MRIKRAIKAGDPNPNTGKIITGLEDKLKELFEANGNRVFIDDQTTITSDNAYEINQSRCIGIVTDYTENDFEIDLTSYGQDLIGNNINDYTIGTVAIIDDAGVCERIARLYLIKKEN